ncbi:hypothetical protein [Acuticoccus mangrovi]|uniref:Uncharacterized protein n=1 Tax=Acuticoccus mangrovi TaxID=2796142 RepID=A0A934MCE9_9HYPH|nr:hypothetical protein [Acuticoccus mangrovi]MBJ3775197.1 hypothetical protein [Acuticoccus mangrovi]
MSRDVLKVTLLGDSHSRSFEDRKTRSPVTLADGRVLDLNVVKLRGATVRGFGRRTSVLQVRRRALGAIRDDDAAVVLAFGQVDVEVGYYYRRLVKGDDMPFDAFAEALAEDYVADIGALDILQTKLAKGIFPSTLTHWPRQRFAYLAMLIARSEGTAEPTDLDEAEVTAGLRDIYPEPAEMDRRHRFFNAALRRRCEAEGIGYFDIDRALVGRRGRLKSRFVRWRINHHMYRSRRLQEASWWGLAAALDGLALPAGEAAPATVI